MASSKFPVAIIVFFTLILTILTSPNLAIGAMQVSQTISFRGVVQQTPTESYTYIISASGSNYLAQNGTSGSLLYTSTSASSLIQDVFNIVTAGQSILVKQGVYTLSSGINCHVSNITFGGEGYGTQFILGAGVNNDVLTVYSASGWYIHDFSVNGNAAQQTYVNPDNEGGIRIRDGSNCIVQRCHVYNAFSKGIKISNNPNSRVLDCNVTGAQANGIAFDTLSNNGIASGNYVSGSSDVGIDAWNSFNCSFINNYVWNITGIVSPYGINSHWGIGTESYSPDATISGNHIWHVSVGIATDDASGDVISNNEISDWDLSEGGNCAIECAASNSIVSQNIISGLIAGVGGGIYVDGNNNLVDGNQVNAGPYAAAIDVGGGARTMGVGETSANNNMIESNYIQSGYYMVVFESIASGNSFTGNTISSTVTGGLYDVGTENTVESNAGYNPVGYIANPINSAGTTLVDSGTSATWASGTTYTVWESPKTLFVSGGTVTTITVNGQILFSVTGSYTIILQPSDTFSVTFTIAPTITVTGQ